MLPAKRSTAPCFKCKKKGKTIFVKHTEFSGTLCVDHYQELLDDEFAEEQALEVQKEEERKRKAAAKKANGKEKAGE